MLQKACGKEKGGGKIGNFDSPVKLNSASCSTGCRLDIHRKKKINISSLKTFSTASICLNFCTCPLRVPQRGKLTDGGNQMGGMNQKKKEQVLAKKKTAQVVRAKVLRGLTRPNPYLQGAKA